MLLDPRRMAVPKIATIGHNSRKNVTFEGAGAVGGLTFVLAALYMGMDEGGRSRVKSTLGSFLDGAKASGDGNGAEAKVIERFLEAVREAQA